MTKIAKIIVIILSISCTAFFIGCSNTAVSFVEEEKTSKVETEMEKASKLLYGNYEQCAS